MKILKNEEPMKSWIGKVRLKCVYDKSSFPTIRPRIGDVIEILRWEDCGVEGHKNCFNNCGTGHKKMIAINSDSKKVEFCGISFNAYWKWIKVK